MTLPLTDELRRILAGHPNEPVRLVDPSTNETYVILRADVFDGLLSSSEGKQEFVRAMYPAMWDVCNRDGWDDPEMDVYNDPNL